MMTSIESAAYPLSHGQRAVWVQQRLAPQSMAYTLAYALRVCGDLDVAALRRAFGALIDRHAVLRATFTDLSGDPAQQIHTRVSTPFVHEDVSGWSEAAVSERLAAEAARPFDLEQGPLTRLRVFTRAAGEHLVLLMLHEIVADARSLQILLPELDTLYQAEKGGVRASLITPVRQYTDDVRRRNETQAGPEGERLWSYWQRQLADAPLMLDLPTSTPRTSARTQGGASYTVALDTALTASLKTLARHEGVALDTLLLAAFQALLSRYTAQEDIVVGALVDSLAGANEDENPFADVVGYHADPLPLRVDLAGDPPFTELLRRVRETVRDARAHRDYPFALLVEPRVPGYAPLAQVRFEWRQARPLAMGDLTPLLLRLSGSPLRFGDLTLEPLALDRGATPLDLTLRMGEVAGEIVASFAYSTDLFDAPLIARLAGHLQVMLAGVMADPTQRLSALPLLTPAEREQLLVAWNGAVAPYPRDRCIHQLIEEQAVYAPDAVAIEYGDERITNRAFDERANRLAHYLQKAGVGPETVVGVCLEPSPTLVVAQFGILKAGGGYVSLDPAFPEERMAFMLADTRAPVFVTQRSLLGRTPSSYAGRVVCVDAEAAAIAQEPTRPVVSGVTPTNTVAVTYTSGSTGQPKGALRSHRTALMIGEQAAAVTPSMGRLAIFDIRLGEASIALNRGATLVLSRKDLRRDPLRLLRFLCDQRIEVTSLPGVVIQQLAEVSAREGLVPADLRQIRTVGEQLRITPEIVRFFEQMPECVLSNVYGSTEGGVATIYTLDGPPSAWPPLPPIGRAVPNAQVYLLDARLQPVPVGVTGELYVGGASLARDYLNRPDLTAERFIPHPFSDEPGARLYKTGDLARYRPDGNIEIVGRGDHQVKLRAFRIELGEIEATLRAHPAVADAVALAREDTPGLKRLVAYVVPRQGRAPGHSDLRAFVAARLPHYMVPAAYVTLAALPRTPNAKVDRRALPAPAPTRPELDTPFAAPCTPIEETLAAIWADVLGIERVGVDDDFFALGGHSLLATRMVAHAREALGVDLPLRRVFETPTVAALAVVVAEATEAADGPRAEGIKRDAAVSSGAAARLLAHLDTLSEAEVDGLLDQLRGGDNAAGALL